MALPLDGNYLGKETLFDSQMLRDTPWANLSWHVFTLHTRWNYDQVDQLMGSNTRHITVLRDPADLFESLFDYSQLAAFYGVADLAQFISNIETTTPSSSSSKWKADERQGRHIGRNQLSWDLGMQPKDFDNATLVWQKVAEMEEHFDLVMITERIDESLVLLQELMCWPMEHLAHLDLNRRKADNTVKLTARQRQVLRSWLRADYIIYDHFRNKLDRLLKSRRLDEAAADEESSDTFDQKLNQLQAINERLIDRCVVDRVENAKLKGSFKSFNAKQMGYIVNE